MNAAGQVTAWRENGMATDFPYGAVLGAYHQGGKHAVDPALLTALAAIRPCLPAGPDDEGRRLAAFLDAALDRHDRRFHYRTYLALRLLPLPDPYDPSVTAAGALHRRDRLVVHLISDLLGFELDAGSGMTDLLPAQRPALPVVLKRLRHGLRAITPALHRLGIIEPGTAGDPEVVAQQVRFAVADALTDGEHLDLRLSMLPVDVVHDEYLFLRVLQAYETTFALLATDLQAAVTYLEQGAAYTAVDRLGAAAAAFRETAPLFSLLATMNPAAFHTFRSHTDGASAIQSEHYKLVESLCRRPDDDRLESAAYRSTPLVHDRVLAGQATVEGTYRAAVADGRITAEVAALLEAAMRQLAEVIGQWRTTHHSIAVRILGAHQSGTGSTEGAGYLLRASTVPVFSTSQITP